MRVRAISLWLCYVGVLYAICLLWTCGLVPGWRRWYSQSEHHRAQAVALLHGELRLSNSLSELRHDLVWSRGGVHQVWGLGVPLWRLPFDLVARLVGEEAFPDMLAFGIAVAIAASIVLMTFVREGARNALHTGYALRGEHAREMTSATRPSHSKTCAQMARVGWSLGGASIVLGFPPFINLLKTRFDIYEEVVAYEYLFGISLLGGLIMLAMRPLVRRYWWLCGVAGLGGLVRPTLVFYGFATVMAGAVLLWLSKRKRKAVPVMGEKGKCPPPGRQWVWHAVVGGLIFMLGGGVLFGTNWRQFGNGFEFGHRLNVQDLYGSLYATRFDDPYQKEPLGSAARELFGWLLSTQEFNAGDFYQERVFPGQSTTLRWREVYLTTYDWSFVIVAIVGVAAAASTWLRWWREWISSDAWWVADACRGRVIGVLGLYSALSAAPLLVFYLRCPVISSRYLLDLMPAFASAMVAGWLTWGSLWMRRGGGLCALVTSGLVLATWLALEIHNGDSAYGPPRVLTWQEIKARAQQPPVTVRLPSSGLYVSAKEAEATHVPFNGAGWLEDTDEVMPCVIVFVKDPEFLELEVAPQNANAGKGAAQVIRAKVGLELLDRQSVRRSDRGWVVRFKGPQCCRYQNGIQPVFLAMVPNTKLAASRTPWRLLSVRWRSVKEAQ